MQLVGFLKGLPLVTLPPVRNKMLMKYAKDARLGALSALKRNRLSREELEDLED